MIGSISTDVDSVTMSGSSGAGISAETTSSTATSSVNRVSGLL